MNTGDKLGPYEIVSLIGKGGMGEVYRARDPRLGRDVAIKVSAARFSERFEREARAVAALNHPNICTLYDVGPNYLVMEYIEGESPKGPMPLDEALRIARQIAEALEAAHEKPIIHRDLKPANIKIKPDGLVKVLDFGLAKMHEPPGEDGDTVPLGKTEEGAILGTPAYMSPEQAVGKKADKRADIWAFGVVLYEMLTGERPFKGKEIGDILESVVKDQPNLNRVPVQIRPLLQRCLEKDRKNRLRDIGDMDLLMGGAPEPATSRRSWLAWGGTALFAGSTGALAFMRLRESAPSSPSPVRFQIAPPESNSFYSLSLSPDGGRLAFVATGPDGRRRLWMRPLDALESRALPGTEDATSPFWSPDGRFVGFVANGKLKKIDTSVGGLAQTICDVPGIRVNGADWSRYGVIVFGQGNDLVVMRVSSAGGAASPVTTLDRTRQEVAHANPRLLPDGRHFLYFRLSTNRDTAGVYIGSVDAIPSRQNLKRLLATNQAFIYAPSPEVNFGYVLFEREGTAFAQLLDTRRLELSGEAVPVPFNIGGFGSASASSNGSLAYLTRRPGSAVPGMRPTWFDRTGKVLGVVADPGQYDSIDLAPDGTRLSVSLQNSNGGIWLYDLARGGKSRFTFGSERDVIGVWSPDGARIVFSSLRDGPVNLYWKLSNGAGVDQLLLKSDAPKWVNDWSRDGRFILYSTGVGSANLDLWVLPMDGDRKPRPYLQTSFNKKQGQFSPDSRFVAYASDETGNLEIYVQPFPEASGGKWMISQNGGVEPRWSRDGKELFYFSGRTLMSVEVETNPAFKAGAPKALFDAPIEAGYTNDGHRWQIAPDGKRFLALAITPGENLSTLITVALNWEAGLKK